MIFLSTFLLLSTVKFYQQFSQYNSLLDTVVKKRMKLPFILLFINLLILYLLYRQRHIMHYKIYINMYVGLFESYILPDMMDPVTQDIFPRQYVS